MPIDIEITNRCNASCHFCPRDRTPHQGLITDEIVTAAIERSAEIHHLAVDHAGAEAVGEFAISLCGLGEALLHPRIARYIAEVRAAGAVCSMSSNGALLTEAKSHAILDAGLQRILINIGDLDEDYEEVYKLPFERTRDRILRFIELAEGRCEVFIVLVDHRQDLDHRQKMMDYWRGHGVHQFMTFDIMNRGGSLFVDHMEYAELPELAEARRLLQEANAPGRCVVPFINLFIGYDGNYYLCCSDWEKQTPMGNVFDRSAYDIISTKLALIADRRPVCQTCNLDPLNQLTELLQSGASSEQVDTWVATSGRLDAALAESLQGLGVDLDAPPTAEALALTGGPVPISLSPRR